RTMLSVAGSSYSIFGNSVGTVQTLPITFQQREMRIQKIAYNLRLLQPNRYLPPDTVHQIQLGMNQIMSQLTVSPPQALTNYNLLMRHIVFNTSLSTTNVHQLNNGFTAVLKADHAPEPALTNLTSSVNQLVSQVDTASVQPVFLATNDNAYLLQLAIVIGQQMPAPRVPSITKATGQQVNPRVAVTPLATPTYTGTYVYGTTMQLINAKTNQVLGQAIVGKNGQFALHITTPLAVGKYHLSLRAVDEVGHISHASRIFGLKVVPPKHHHA
ncbi:MAG: Ig-like domain-containing protein, partial [Isosphaeraceae bacterium]